MDEKEEAGHTGMKNFLGREIKSGKGDGGNDKRLQRDGGETVANSC